MVFSLVGLPSLFFAFIAVISSSFATKPTDVFIDGLMRLLFIVLPVVLFIVGHGLFYFKKWGRDVARITGLILFLIMFLYGITGIKYPNSNDFISFCFVGAAIFLLIVIYLSSSNVRQHFNKIN